MTLVGIMCALVLFPGKGGAEAPSDNDAQKAKELIQHVLARTTVVFSGRLEYTRITEFRFRPGAGGKENCIFSFQGSDWAMRSGNGDVAINRDAHSLDFRAKSRIDEKGKIVSKARLSVQMKLSTVANPPPIFAGTFWYTEPAHYIERNTSSAHLKGKEIIDGIECFVLEWDIDKSKLSAFGATTRPLNHGGRLRIYTAPRLGAVLPRVEYITTEGEVEARFDAREFVETRSGVFIPREIQAADKSTGYLCKYSITRIEKINEEIPDSDFVATLPVNTAVADTRSAKGKKGAKLAMLTERTSSEDIDKLFVTPAEPEGQKWRWPVIVLSGMALGFASYYLVRRLAWWKKNA